MHVAFTDPEFLQGMKHTAMEVKEHEMYETYDAFVRTTAIFKADRGIQYCITKLTGEIGEFNDKVADMISSQSGFTDAYFEQYAEHTQIDALALELGDIMWYCAALSQQLGYNFPLLMGIHPRPLEILGGQPGIKVLSLGLRLSGQAGFVAERAGKLIRDKDCDGTNAMYLTHDEFRTASMRNLANIVEVIRRIGRMLGYELETIVDRNIGKLMSRKNRGVLSGSGDNR